MSYRPEGDIRRSQLLFRAGPGALVDLLDHAVVISGLDRWGYRSETEGFDLREPRLEDRALKMLRGSGNWRFGKVRLRRPPHCDDDLPSPKIGIKAREFPYWFLCQSSACNSLIGRRALDEKHRHMCHDKVKGKGVPAVPVRFVLACSRGHLMDVNWRAFVHYLEREQGVAEDSPFFCHEQPGVRAPGDARDLHIDADLYLAPLGTSGDLSDYIVGCRRCGKTRGLQDLQGFAKQVRCQGWRPWLPPGANEECDQRPALITRTATNAYFPRIISALSIPESNQEVMQLVEAYWSDLHKVDSAAKFGMLREMLDRIEGAFQNYEDDEVYEAIVAKRNRGAVSQSKSLREPEWEALMDAGPELAGEFPPANEPFWAKRLEGVELPPFLDRVVLVHTLREVRAQVDFTRLESLDQDAEGEYQLEGQHTSPLAVDADWIPAIEARGEGIFLAFDERRLRQWEHRDAVQRAAARFRLPMIRGGGDEVARKAFIARLVMLHTLSHMLITQISLECGYPAASIRERLYCARHPSDASRSRAGILLYTGTPGAGGTLGGLVEVGREVVRHLGEAANRALLCSNDPVCAQHDPSVEEEGRGRHGAACHACVLIAETSCERFNHDLDRTLVVPTVGNTQASFLGEWLGT